VKTFSSTRRRRPTSVTLSDGRVSLVGGFSSSLVAEASANKANVLSEVEEKELNEEKSFVTFPFSRCSCIPVNTTSITDMKIRVQVFMLMRIYLLW